MEQPARYCEYCGKPLNAQARFCGRCGKPVDLGEQVSPPAQAAPPQGPVRLPPAAKPSQPPPAPPRQAQAAPPAVQRQSQPPAAPPRQAQPPPPPPAGQRQVQAPPPRPLPVAPAPPNRAAAPAEMVCGVIPGAFQRKGMLGLGQQSITLVLTNYRVIFAMQTNQMLQEQVRLVRAEAKEEGKGFFGQWGAQLSASSKYYQQKPPEAILAEQPGNFFIPHNQLGAVKFHVIRGADDSRDEYRLDFEAATGKVSVLFTMIDQKKAKQALTQVLGERVHWSNIFFG